MVLHMTAQDWTTRVAWTPRVGAHCKWGDMSAVWLICHIYCTCGDTEAFCPNCCVCEQP